MAVKPLVQDPALRKLLKNIESASKPEYEYDPEKQIEGYKKRLEGSGIDPEKALDERGPIERLFNLPEKQNPLFDFFEVIGRPQQAAFGAVKAAFKGEDVGKAAVQGITGDQYVRFKEVLHEIGMDDSEKLGVDDIVGFVGDVFLDPMNLALIPATGGASLIAKQTKAVEQAEDMLKMAKAAKEAGNVFSGAAKIDDVIELYGKNVERAKGLLKKAEKVRLISPLRYGMRGIKEGGKGAFRALDVATDNILQKLDMKQLKKAFEAKELTEEVFTKVKKAVDGGAVDTLNNLSKHLKMTGVYRNIKKTIRETFDGLASIPKGLLQAGKKIDSKTKLIVDMNEKRLAEYTKKLAAKADELGFERNAFARMVADVMEHGDLQYSTSVAEYLANPRMAQRVGIDRASMDEIVSLVDEIDPTLAEGYEQVILDVSNRMNEFADVNVQKAFDDAVESSLDFKNKITAAEDDIRGLEMALGKEKDPDVIKDIRREIRNAKRRLNRAKHDLGKTELSMSEIRANAEKGSKMLENDGRKAMFYRHVDEEGFEVIYIDHEFAEKVNNRFVALRESGDDAVLKKGATRELTADETRQINIIEDKIVAEEKAIAKMQDAEASVGGLKVVQKQLDKKLAEKQEVIERLRRQYDNATNPKAKEIIGTKLDKAEKEGLELMSKRADVDKRIQRGLKPKVSVEEAATVEEADELRKIDESIAKEELKIKNRADDASVRAAKKQVATLKKKRVSLEESIRDRAGKSAPTLEQRQTNIDEMRKQLEELRGRTVVKPDTTVKDFADRLDVRRENKRFYTQEEAARFEELGGFTRDEATGAILKKDFSELTHEQQVFREMMDETHTMMTQLLKSIDELGSDLINTINPGSALNNAYLPHWIHPARLDLDARFREATANWVDTKSLKGNTRAMSARAWRTSRLEAERLSKTHIDNLIHQGLLKGEYAEFWSKNRNVKLFEDHLIDAMRNWSSVTTKSVGATAKTITALDELLVASVATEELLRPVFRGEQIPFGMVEVEKATLVKKLEGMKNFVKDEKIINNLIGRIKGKEGDVFAMNRNIFEYIGIIQAKEGKSEALKAVMKVMDLFKRNKLMTPGFQLRNITGNFDRMYLAGVPVKKQVKYLKKAHNILKKGDELFTRKSLDEFATFTLEEQKILQTYEEFMGLGFDELGRTIHDLPQDLWKGRGDKYDNLFNAVAGKNAQLNWEIDKRFRMALYMYGKDTPDFLARYATDDAADVVRYVLFDYSDLSHIEKKYMRNIIPFYTFTKKNLAFQAKHIFAAPEKYNKLINAVENLWGNISEDPDAVEKFKKESMWIPIPIIDKNGNYQAIKANLTPGDFGNFLDNPLQSMVSMTAPYLRAPFEIALNKQTFSQMPIQEFEGQRGYQFPQISRGAEYAIGQLGLDVPLKTFISDPIRGFKSALEGGNEDMPSPLAQGAAGWGLSLGNTEKAQRRAAYEKLDHIRDLMKYYKQEGVDVLTLAEIENRNRPWKDAIERLKGTLR